MSSSPWGMRALFFALCLPCTGALAADPAAFTATVHDEALLLQPTRAFAAYTLTVTGPHTRYTLAFDAGATPAIDLIDPDGAVLPDGAYVYELAAAPHVSADRTAKRDTDATRPRGARVAGTFHILEGRFLRPEQAEAGALAKTQDPGRNGLEEDPPVNLIVPGAACVGYDCIDEEVFGSDTLRLKESNLRIHFQDTSSGTYPTNDWRLIANDATSGGANYLAVEDTTGAATPFKIMAGARAHALAVSSAGYVGLGTLSPQAVAHAVDGDTPSLRLEQDISDSLPAQTWDLGGNEDGFFVADVTGATTPLTIETDAPDHSVVVTDTGDVGLGTATPQARLHVAGDTQVDGDLDLSGAGAALSITDTTGSTGNRFLLTLSNQGNTKLSFQNTAYDQKWELVGGNAGQFYFYKLGETDHALDLYGSGDMTISGTLTQNSDVTVKEHIEAVDPLDVLHGVLALPITTWNYQDNCDDVRHMGPMAQDFFSTFGLNGRDDGISSMDTGGVALGAIQGLAQLLEAKDAQIAALEARLKAQEAQAAAHADEAAAQERRLAALEAALLR